MLVRSLIGKHAGQIVDMPYAVAQSCMAAGTVAEVNEQDVREAQAIIQEGYPLLQADSIPDGYSVKPDEVEGWNVFDPGGARLNGRPLPNAVAARSYAMDYHQTEAVSVPSEALRNQQKQQADAEKMRAQLFKEEEDRHQKAREERDERLGVAY